MTFGPPVAENQMFPSGPLVTPLGVAPLGIEKSVDAPAGVMRPIACAPCSLNHMLLSGPFAMSKVLLAPGTLNVVIVPLTAISPILPLRSVNHRKPVLPAAMCVAKPPPFGMYVCVPVVVIWTTSLGVVNQRLWSEPVAM